MTRLGRYEVESELGRGSMGIVYLAHDPHIRRRVAVKTISLPDGLSAPQREEFRKRFLREAQAAGSLTHPGIVTIYGVEETDDRDLPIITMEYVAGRNLQHILKTEGRLVPERAFQMAMALAEALQTAHSAGIVHRDIKPANILVRDADGAVKITDFGIARVPLGDLTEGSGVLGSPSYMAPEQIRYGKVDSRSDLFALAVILWESLSGERLYTGDDIVTIGHRIVSEPPPSITARVRGLPATTDAFFERALAKDPAQRFQSAAAFREAINELLLEIELDLLSAVGAPDSPFVVASPPERPRAAAPRTSLLERWGRPRRIAAVVGGLLLIGVSAMTLRSLSGGDSAELSRTSQVATPAGRPEQQTAPARAPAESEARQAETSSVPAAGAPAATGPAGAQAAPTSAPATPSSAVAPGATTAPAASGKVASRPAPAPLKTAPAKPAVPPAVTAAAPDTEALAEEGSASDPGTEAAVGSADPDAIASAATGAQAASVETAALVVSLASRVKDGTLVLLLDGQEIFSAELEAHAKRFQRILKKVTQQAQASFEQTLDIPPGRHQLTARLTVAGKSNVSEASIDLDFEAGTTRMVEIVAGKKFGVGDPLAMKLGE